MMARTASVLLVAGLILGLGGGVPAAADTAMHGRVSYEAGGAMVKGTADSDWSYATVNTLVLPGDTLWADAGALLEVEMNGGTFLRLADQSKVDVVSLPPNAVFRGWSGSFYVHRVSRSTGAVAFQTPACVIDAERDTHARVDIVENGATTVSVRWGRVTLRTEAGTPVVVGPGQRSYVDPGFLPSLPQRFDTNTEDDFDAWSRERARLVALGSDALPKSYRVTSAPLGTADLVNYGDWVYVDNTPYWRPTVIADYTPYRSGIWSYVPAYGYNWVGDYPFCYITSHYGRWTHHANYGWLWTYTDVWGPAWVASVRYGPYFAWAPLDPFGYPVRYGSSVFDFGSFRLTIGAGSYCLADNLFYGYTYGRPLTSSVFTNVSGNNIYVWNIFGNTVNVNYPWAGGLPVRDYKPQRVIRGASEIAAGSRVIRAGERATRLETATGRSAFQAVDRTGARGVRTRATAHSRDARIRAVGVDEARAREGLRTSERVARAAEATVDRTQRGSRVASTEERDGRDAGADAATDVARTGRDATDRKLPDETAYRDDVTRGRSGRGTDTASTRTVPDTDRSIERGQRTVPDADRSIERGERTAPSAEGRSSREISTNRTAGPSARTEARSGPRTITLDSSGRSGGPDRSAGPSRGTSRSVESAPQGPSRVESPRSVDRGSRSIERSAPSSVERSAPSSPRTIERSSPNVERSAPSSPRSIDRGAPSAPSRTTGPRAMSTTPRTISLPPNTYSRSASVTPQAPRQQASAPSRSYQAPRVQPQAPSRTYEAPRSQFRAPSQTYQAPRAQVQAPTRTYEAPRQMQAPQPQIQAPSRQMSAPAPRVEMPSAPQRSIQRMEAPSAPQVSSPSIRGGGGPSFGGSSIGRGSSERGGSRAR